MVEKDQTAVKANSTKYFNTQEEAREYAIKLLEAGLTFITITDKDDC